MATKCRRSRPKKILSSSIGLLFLVVIVCFFSNQFTLTALAQVDDFADFDSDDVVETASEIVADEGDFAEFGDDDPGIDDADGDDEDPDTIDHIQDHEYDENDDDDGEVEDVDETDSKVQRDDFDIFGDEFGDDQIVKTYPGDKGDSRKASSGKGKPTEKGERSGDGRKPGLVLKEVPEHLRNNWKLFYVEGILIAFILYYVFNFFTGCEKNQAIAKAWFAQNREYLRTQFSQIGEPVVDSQSESTECLTSQSHNIFTIWCTGRKGIEGMFIEIRLVPRQDLISIWRNKFNRKRPQTQDTVTFSIYLGEEHTEPIVLALGKLGTVTELWRQYGDLRTYCQKGIKDKSSVLKGYHGCVESMEMMAYLIDTQAKTWFQEKDGCLLNYMHISDNYTCIADQDREEEPKKEGKPVKKATKMMVVGLLLSPEADGDNNSEVFTRGTLYVLERLRRLRLTAQIKQGCEKRRMKAIEDDQKRQHQSRHAQAAERAEVRRRQLNKRIMEEEDDSKAQKLQNELNKKDWKAHNKRMTRGQKTAKVR